MIKVNELRIGGWVLCNGLRTIVNDTLMISILKNDVQFTIDPIPLNAEILEKCGFKYWDMEPNFSGPSDAYWVHPKMKFSINNLSWTVQKIGVKLKYLHQLQNLYLDLTGEELPFKI